MAYFAKINNNNIVEQVFVISDESLIDANGNSVDKLGIDLCRYLSNYDNWIKADYAAEGYYYNAATGTFMPPKPYDSWVLVGNEWEAPTHAPIEDGKYFWNEEILNWQLDENSI